MPLLDRVLSVVAPHTCVVCSAEGKLLCKWCAPDAFPALPSRCYRCQSISTDSATCEGCRRHSPLKHVWAATNYDNAAKQLLHVYKFERARVAAPIIGDAIAQILPYISSGTFIVPVPTATVRIRQRGYDHALLIARSLAAIKNLELVWAVSRVTQSRQVGADRQKRQDQLKNAFIVSKPKAVKVANILIIDDVLTTGATLEAMASALKQAGAKTITAAVFAQKQ